MVATDTLRPPLDPFLVDPGGPRGCQVSVGDGYLAVRFSFLGWFVLF